MTDPRPTGRAVRAGAAIVQARVALWAGWVAAVGGGSLAVLGCVIAWIAGSGPGPLAFLLIVLGVAAACFLVVRWLVARVNAPLLAAAIARRIVARRAARRGGRPR